MQKNQRLPFTLLAAALITSLFAGPVVSCPAKAEGRAPERVRQMKPLSTGSIKNSQLSEDRKKRLDECMSIWDPGTHMTKRQWRRTCNNQLDEIPNL